jgi:hypothetical protein
MQTVSTDEALLSAAEAAPVLPVGSGRHWAMMHSFQRKAGLPFVSPPVRVVPRAMCVCDACVCVCFVAATN